MILFERKGRHLKNSKNQFKGIESLQQIPIF